MHGLMSTFKLGSGSLFVTGSTPMNSIGKVDDTLGKKSEELGTLLLFANAIVVLGPAKSPLLTISEVPDPSTKLNKGS